MRSNTSLLLSLVLAVVLVSPFASLTRGQTVPGAPAQAFEPFVNRIQDALKLSEEQISELRRILVKHAPKLMELRNRAQSMPFAPGLQAEVEKQQRAIREELSAILDEDQKVKFATVDTRPLIPLRAAFVPINIPPRIRMEAGSTRLAANERVIQAPSGAAKNRTARLTDEQRVVHLLNRIAFGPRPGDFARVKQIGADRFIEEQLHPETIDDSELEKRLALLPTQRMSSSELYQFYPPQQVAEQRASDKNAQPIFGRPQQMLGELIQQKLVRAVSSNRQLQEVMTDFWFNHFNIFAPKEADQWFVTSYERDVIRPQVLGKFRDLLLATAQSPAMLFYLDNWLSASPDSARPRPPGPRQQNAQPPTPAPGAGSKPSEVIPIPGSTDAMMRKDQQPQSPPSPNPQSPSPIPQPPRRPPGINENYARELMELHTLGVDGGYTQKDVQEVARCLTGWTIDRPYQGGGFLFRPWTHDGGAKTVLGTTIPAGGGISDGLRVIEILSKHPSTARFISKKLCQRFVSDDPPAQLVERITQVFLKSDGDIREVVRAIVTSPEFNSAAAFRSKIKSPLELAASAIRALDGDTNGGPQLHDWIRRMGEPLYQHASPTGYGEDSSKWINTGVFFNRINFAVSLANNQLPGTSYDPMRLVSEESVANHDELTNQLLPLILHTELSADSMRAVRTALEQSPATTAALRPALDTGSRSEVATARAPLPAEANPQRRRIYQLIGLLMGTAEFQRR